MTKVAHKHTVINAQARANEHVRFNWKRKKNVATLLEPQNAELKFSLDNIKISKLIYFWSCVPPAAHFPMYILLPASMLQPTLRPLKVILTTRLLPICATIGFY